MSITNLNSKIVAIFLSQTLICSIINIVIEIPNLSVIVTAFLMFFVLIFNKNYKKNIKLFFIVYFLIIILLITSSVFNTFNAISRYIIFFLVFGSASLLFTSINVDYRKIIESLIIIYFIYLFAYLFIIRNTFLVANDYWSDQMGQSYGFVPMVLLSFAYINYSKYFSQNKILKRISIVVGICSLYFILFDCATRGAILTILISLIIMIIGRYEGNKKMILIFILSVLCTVVLFAYNDILLWLNSILNDLNLNILSISKTVRRISLGTADSGRNELYMIAWDYIKQSPIIGNGIGYFELNQGIYIHNILIEIICEYGLVGFFLCGFFLFKSARSSINCEDINDLFKMFLFCYTIPMLFFSNTYWLIPHFWFYLFFEISTKKIKGGKHEKCISNYTNI